MQAQDFTIWGTHHDSRYGPHPFAYFNQDRDLRTVVQGNPFPGISNDEFGEKVAASMRGRNAFGYTHFTTTPGESDNPNTYLVVRFNPRDGYTGARLCSDPSPAPAVETRQAAGSPWLCPIVCATPPWPGFAAA